MGFEQLGRDSKARCKELFKRSRSLCDRRRGMLDEFGCKLVGPATNGPRAPELIGKESIEIAVLDLNLDG